MATVFLSLLTLTALLTLTSAAAPHATAPAAAPASTPATPNNTTPVPSNLTAILSNKGCKAFAGLLTSRPDVLSVFNSEIMAGLTVFCPSDRAVAAFTPKYKNLTADQKSSFLLYHGVPVHYSLSDLKSGNGVMNSLATQGAGNYNLTIQDDGDQVSVKTGINTAQVTGTAFDDHTYLAVFTISDVLQPLDIFQADLPPAPAPAPSPSKKKKKPTKKHAVAPAPADSPDATPADAKAADDSSSTMWSVTAWHWAVVVAAAAGIAAAA